VRFDYKIVDADSSGALSVLEIEIPPKTLVKPHMHTREDEYSIILSGTVGARIADQILEVGPGSYLAKPRNIPHAMWNASDELEETYGIKL
jgi:quercetin dioxygenase-like cupin family protein